MSRLEAGHNASEAAQGLVMTNEKRHLYTPLNTSLHSQIFLRCPESSSNETSK